MRKFLASAAVAVALLIGSGSAARADFEVQFSYGGGVITIDDTTGQATASGGASLNGATINGTAVSGTSASFTIVNGKITVSGITISPTGTSGGFTIDANISKSNSPGSNFTATLSTSGLDIMNNTGVSGNSTLSILTGDTGYLTPAGSPISIASTVSASADGLNSGNASVIFNSYVDTSNTQFGQPAGGAAPTITLSPIAPGGSASGNTQRYVNGGTPFSLTQLEQITLKNGDSLFDGSSGTTVTAPVPQSMLMALTGLPLLGVRALRLRRRNPIAS